MMIANVAQFLEQHMQALQSLIARYRLLDNEERVCFYLGYQRGIEIVQNIMAQEQDWDTLRDVVADIYDAFYGIAQSIETMGSALDQTSLLGRYKALTLINRVFDIGRCPDNPAYIE